MALIHQNFGVCKGATFQRPCDPELITYNFTTGGASIAFGDYGWQYVMDRIEDGYVAARHGREVVLSWYPGSDVVQGGEA